MGERDATSRYLKALDPDAAGSEAAPPWPVAVRRTPFDFSYPLDAQWLDDAHIAGYLASLRRLAAARETGLPPVCDLPRDWRADTHPLLLSEFLAYKAALAYREPGAIREDLLGNSRRTGHAYCAGIETAAFFDSAQRHLHPPAGRFQRPAAVRYGDTQALAFTARRTAYIVLSGSERFRDVSERQAAELTDRAYPGLPTVPQSLVGSPRPARRTGYAIAWGAIAPDLEAWVREEQRLGRIDRLVLCGHALGGALALLGALHFAQSRACPIHAVITFGAPRVGGEDFKRAYEHPAFGLKERTLRLEAAEDLAVSLDPGPNDLVHVGHAWRFRKRPLRPWWQMLLWAPLAEPERAAAQALARARRRAREEEGEEERDRERDRRSFTAGGIGDNRRGEPGPIGWRQMIRDGLARIRRLVRYAAAGSRRARQARRLENDYALYLSTLSYRKIRAHHVALASLRLMSRRSYERAPILMEKAFRQANKDLENHLAFVRGRHPRTFRRLAARPIRVASPAEVERIEKRFPSYLA